MQDHSAVVKRRYKGGLESTEQKRIVIDRGSRYSLLISFESIHIIFCLSDTAVEMRGKENECESREKDRKMKKIKYNLDNERNLSKEQQEIKKEDQKKV